MKGSHRIVASLKSLSLLAKDPFLMGVMFNVRHRQMLAFVGF